MKTPSINFRIALAQLLPFQDSAENLKKGLWAAETAKKQGADLLLFPEMWSIGYELSSISPKELENRGISSLDDPFLLAFAHKAATLHMAIAITYLGMGPKGLTNNLTLFNQWGAEVFTYRKVKICSFPGGHESTLVPGDQFKVGPLEIREHCLSIGGMICFDREFPESARALRDLGAEIVLVPNSCPMMTDSLLGDIRFQQLRARAFENMMGMALTNYPAPKEDGGSCGIDVDGHPLRIVGLGEEISVINFDLEKIRRWREVEVWK